jgi:NADPH:quinone reductase
MRWGAGVTRFAPGQRVWSNNQGYGGRQGTFAEFVSADEELLYPLPDGINEQEAVTMIMLAKLAASELTGSADGNTPAPLRLRR